MKKEVTTFALATVVGTSMMLSGVATPVFAQENTDANVEEKEIEKNEVQLHPTQDEEGSLKPEAELEENSSKEQPEEEKKETNSGTEEHKEEPVSVQSNDSEQEKKKEIVSIPDVRLKRILNKQLKQSPDSDITVDQLSKISYLDITNQGITNLEGLEHCTELDTLLASYNDITDLTPISKLKKLRSVDAYENKITFLPDISGMDSISSFRVHDNAISDISLLANGIPRTLNVFGLSRNRIQDISSLRVYNPFPHAIRNVQMDLSDNNIRDISSLANKKFYRLKLDGNHIHDISPIKKSNIEADFLYIYNQKLSQDVYVGNNKEAVVEVPNILVGVDGHPIPVDFVNNQGVYDSKTNTITWKNMDSQNVSYEYAVKKGTGENWMYSGQVTLNVMKKNEAPSIHAEDKVLTVGDSFNPLEGVSAHDLEDKEIPLTDKNIIENTVDMTKAGIYTVTYEVIDSHGDVTTKTIKVTVNPKMTSINTVPTIQATDRQIQVGDSFNPLEGVTAYDEEDKELPLTKENVIQNNVDVQKAGTYTVTYKVTDRQGASVTKTITVTVENKNVTENQGQNSQENKESVTTAASTNKTPKTSIATNVGLWGSVFAASIAMLIGFVLKNRKK